MKVKIYKRNSDVSHELEFEWLIQFAEERGCNVVVDAAKREMQLINKDVAEYDVEGQVCEMLYDELNKMNGGMS